MRVRVLRSLNLSCTLRLFGVVRYAPEAGSEAEKTLADWEKKMVEKYDQVGTLASVSQ
jgi:hypothetical protein